MGRRIWSDRPLEMSRLRLFDWLAALPPFVVGFASYGWVALLSSTTGKACGPQNVPGTGLSARLSFLPLIVVPGVVVA